MSVLPKPSRGSGWLGSNSSPEPSLSRPRKGLLGVASGLQSTASHKVEFCLPVTSASVPLLNLRGAGGGSRLPHTWQLSAHAETVVWSSFCSSVPSSQGMESVLMQINHILSQLERKTTNKYRRRWKKNILKNEFLSRSKFYSCQLLFLFKPWQRVRWQMSTGLQETLLHVQTETPRKAHKIKCRL